MKTSDFSNLEIVLTALTMFAAWLTTRDGTLQVGSTHPSTNIDTTLKQFCEYHGLPQVNLTAEHFARWKDEICRGQPSADKASG